jgi:hypothetical protein
MQRLKIDVKKISKEFLFDGAKGLYLDCTLMDNRDGQDQYGYDGFIVQDVGKERREAGIKGQIIGNWKHIGQQQRQPATPPPLAAMDDGLDEIPF